jgi:hypothetical protein
MASAAGSKTFSVLFGGSTEASNADESNSNEFDSLFSRLNAHASEKSKSRLSSNLLAASSMDKSLRYKMFNEKVASPSNLESESFSSSSPVEAVKLRRASIILNENIELAPAAVSSRGSFAGQSISLPSDGVDSIDDTKFLCKVYEEKLLVVRG